MNGLGTRACARLRRSSMLAMSCRRFPHSSPRRGHVRDAVAHAAGERLDGQRRIDPAAGREQRSVAHPQVRDRPAAAVLVDDAVLRDRRPSGSRPSGARCRRRPTAPCAPRGFEHRAHRASRMRRSASGRCRNKRKSRAGSAGRTGPSRRRRSTRLCVLRLGLADDAQARDMIVAGHLLAQRHAPQAALHRQRLAPSRPAAAPGS